MRFRQKLVCSQVAAPKKGMESIKDAQGKPQLLEWWKSLGKSFPKLQPVVRDLLAIQSSSVASESAFSAARYQIGEHRYSLASDSLEISVLFRDWINAERKNYGRPSLPVQFEYDIDNILVNSSEDGMDALEDQAQQPLPENVTREFLETLRKDYFQGFKY